MITKMNKQIFILTIFTILLIHTKTKNIQTTFHMTQLNQTQGWFYVGKIVLNIGNVQLRIKTQKIQGTARNYAGFLSINLISDSQWQMQNVLKCKNKNIPSTQTLTHQLLLQNSISISQHTILINKQQLYYIVIKDCNKKFESDYNNTQLQIKINIDIINNGSYMGQQQDHWLIIPIVLIIGIWMIMTDKYFLRAQYQNDPDYAKMILFGAIGSNISSLMWRSFGYIIYLVRGSNYILFHMIYLFMHSISESMVLCLLILISMGWSLNYLTGPKLDIAIPIISFLAIMNIVLAFMTQLNNSAHDMHHTFDAPTGSILIIVRLILGFGFIISIAFTINSSRYRIRQFLKKFGFLSILYICAMPFIVFIANKIMPAKERNQFVFVSVQITKTICNILLMYMVSSSKSQYNKLCYKNASFLPNQTGLF